MDWGISEVMYIVETMYWIGNWIGSFPLFFYFYLYDEKPKYWDFELDWGMFEVMHICKNIYTGVNVLDSKFDKASLISFLNSK